MSLEPGTKILNNKYIVLRKLDEGRFGHVYKIQNIQTGEYFALKSISRKEIAKNNDLRNNIIREVQIHKSLNHPNIIKLIETGITRSRKFIVLEYAILGDLWDLLYRRNNNSYFDSDDSSYDSSDDSSNDETSSNDSNDSQTHHKKYFSENEARDYFYQIIQGLIYLRNRGIIHRDIKLENILITENGIIKLADFGWATDIPSSSHVGTTKYNSPEMIFSSNNYNHKTDIWSCGILLYEFLFGDVPFEGKNTTSIENKINDGKVIFPDDIEVSANAKDLILKILSHRPEDRPDYEDILSHPWMFPILEIVAEENSHDYTNSEIEIEADKAYMSLVENEIEAELARLSHNNLHN